MRQNLPVQGGSSAAEAAEPGFIVRFSQRKGKQVSEDKRSWRLFAAAALLLRAELAETVFFFSADAESGAAAAAAAGAFAFSKVHRDGAAFRQHRLINNKGDAAALEDVVVVFCFVNSEPQMRPGAVPCHRRDADSRTAYSLLAQIGGKRFHCRVRCCKHVSSPDQKRTATAARRACCDQ